MPLGNKIQNVQSSTAHVIGYEKLKEYTFIKTKYNTINETIHHKDITIHHKDATIHHNAKR